MKNILKNQHNKKNQKLVLRKIMKKKSKMEKVT